MALTTDDYKLRLAIFNSTYNEWYHNAFYYKREGDPADAVDLVAAFISTVIPDIEAILPTTSNAAQVRVENLGDPDDYHENLSVTFAGDLTAGEMMPKWDVWAYRIVRGSRNNKRHGRKVFGPIPEANCANGAATGGSLTLLNALETPLWAIISGATSWTICVPRSTKVSAPETKLGFKYVIQELIKAAAVEFIRVSTQNSHK